MIDPKFTPSSAQHRRIFYRPFKESVRLVTYEVLERKGFFHRVNGRRQFTDDAHEWVKPRLVTARESILLDHPGVELVHSDHELVPYLMKPEVDIYVYRAKHALVVRNGDGQKPMAVLDPYYLWKIESARTEGLFLKYQSVSGYKSSYGYGMKDYR